MDNTNETRNKMIAHIKAIGDDERRANRCPSIKKMAEYIRVKHPDWKVIVNGRSCEKKGRASGMMYYTSGGNREYNGYTIIVKVGDKEIINHDTTETYRTNRDVAIKIMAEEGWSEYGEEDN